MPWPWSEFNQELVQRAQDEQELLLRLRQVGGDAAPILRALVDAVTVLGYSHVETGLRIMAARPPALYSMASRRNTPDSVYEDPDVAALTSSRMDTRRCTSCSKWITEGWQRHEWQGKLLCPACFHKALFNRETTPGTAVAATKPLGAWSIPIPYEDAPAPKPFLAPAVETIRKTLEDKLDAVIANATGGPDWRKVIEPGAKPEPQEPVHLTVDNATFARAMAGRLTRDDLEDIAERAEPLLGSCTECGAARGHRYFCRFSTFLAEQEALEKAEVLAPPGLGHVDEPEVAVAEAVTPDVAALLAAGDVSGAQALIMGSFDALDEQEVVTLPARMVMPMPRASNLPKFSFEPVPNRAITPRAPTGKPCRVCMKDAYHIHSSPTGKPWHYCDDHEPEV